MSIRYSCQDVKFELSNERQINRWIEEIVIRHGKRLGSINYCFCSDGYILQINRQFLDHDTYTDIITFDNVCGNSISGDILISLDRVRENAEMIGVSFKTELYRVLIHGILHLLGFNDKSDKDIVIMRKKEDDALSVLASMV